MELLLVDICLHQGKMLIGLFYAPPTPSAPVPAINELEAALLNIRPLRLKSAVLLGRSNINLLSAAPHTNPSFLPMRDLAC